MNIYLVIESTNTMGKVAYVETVNNTINLLKYSKDDNINSVSVYRIKGNAQAYADFLNKLYKEQAQ